MNTKALFPCGRGSNLILGTGMENQIFILRTLGTIKFFHQILKNCHFGVKEKSLPTQMDLYDPYMIPTLFPRGVMIFQGVLNKFPFLSKFPYLEKIVDLRKDLKYEHQSTSCLWGRVKLNFRDKYGKSNINSKNSSHCQVFFLQDCQKMTLA